MGIFPVLDLGEVNSQGYVTAMEDGKLILINRNTKKMIFIQGSDSVLATVQFKFADGIRGVSLDHTVDGSEGDKTQPTDNKPVVLVSNPLEGHRPLQFV